MSSILPTVAYSATVTDRQKRLLAAAAAADLSVQACAGLSDSTRAAWGQFYATVVLFCREDVGWYNGFLRAGSMVDQSESYGTELVAWQQKLAGYGCASVGPIYDPNATTTAQTETMKLIQYGIFAVIACAGAYGVGKVISIIPKQGVRQPKQLVR